MILFNVLEMGRGIFFHDKVEATIKETLARELVEAAVEIFNYPGIENTRTGELLHSWEDVYGPMAIDKLLEGLLTHIRKQTKFYGWDKRCMAKLEFFGDGRGLLMARVVQDLDETYAKIHEYNEIKPDDQAITEVVSDNPDSETLNELITAGDNETIRNLQILSRGVPSSVRPDTEPGWRVLQWEDRGPWGV